MKAYETATAITRGTRTGLSQCSANPMSMMVKVTKLAVCNLTGEIFLRDEEDPCSLRRLATSKSSSFKSLRMALEVLCILLGALPFRFFSAKASPASKERKDTILEPFLWTDARVSLPFPCLAGLHATVLFCFKASPSASPKSFTSQHSQSI